MNPERKLTLRALLMSAIIGAIIYGALWIIKGPTAEVHMVTLFLCWLFPTVIGFYGGALTGYQRGRIDGQKEIINLVTDQEHVTRIVVSTNN